MRLVPATQVTLGIDTEEHYRAFAARVATTDATSLQSETR